MGALSAVLSLLCTPVTAVYATMGRPSCFLRVLESPREPPDEDPDGKAAAASATSPYNTTFTVDNFILL